MTGFVHPHNLAHADFQATSLHASFVCFRAAAIAVGDLNTRLIISSNHSLAIRFTDDTQGLDKCSSWQFKKTANRSSGVSATQHVIICTKQNGERLNEPQPTFPGTENVTGYGTFWGGSDTKTLLERPDATAGCFGRQLPL